MPKIESGYASLVQENKDRFKTISFLISGVRCAVCIQKIESILAENDCVRHVRLNFSTGRLNVVWDGSCEIANQFAEKIKSLGYVVRPFDSDHLNKNLEDEHRFLLLCLGVAGFAMGNIMLVSVGLWTTNSETMGIATRDLLHWISALIAIPAIIFSGRPFFRSAWNAIKNRRTNMDVPISVAFILATTMSIFEIFHHGEHAYFDSAVMLMFFLLIGRYLDFRARRHAKNVAHDLMQTFSGFASVINGNQIHRVLIRDLRQGMQVLIAPGKKIPVDGIIEEGVGTIDTSLVTGETLPRSVQIGSDVFAGTINQSTALRIRVQKSAENSLLSDIVQLMEKAEQGQARYVRLADRAAKLYTPVVHIFAVLCFVLWWGVWGVTWQIALMTSMTVLIITCPCALGLAVPVVQVLASGLLIKRGILLKSGDALERLANIDTVFFDKTGTLTIGKPRLIGNHEFNNLPLAASLAAHSQHPLSKGLAQSYQGDLVVLSDVQEFPGQGVQAFYQDTCVRLGRVDWCGGSVSDHQDIEIALSVEGKIVDLYRFEDPIRSDAAGVIKKIEDRHLQTILISGDRQVIADRVGQKVGIKKVFSEQSPVDKYNKMASLKEEGRKILMIGDGLNDAPVLAGSDVSMAPGTAIDMAQNAADIIFMGDLLSPVLFAHTIAVHAQKLVKINFVLTIIYNAIAIPMAFSGWVTPMVAAFAMSGSSLVVIANSYRLKRVS